MSQVEHTDLHFALIQSSVNMVDGAVSVMNALRILALEINTRSSSDLTEEKERFEKIPITAERTAVYDYAMQSMQKQMHISNENLRVIKELEAQINNLATLNGLLVAELQKNLPSPTDSTTTH